MSRALLLCFWLSVTALPAQHAPLLTFVGTAERGPGSDGEHTWLADPTGDGPAEDLGPGRIRVHDTFDDDWLVCSSGWPKTCYVLLARRPDEHGHRLQHPLVPGGHCQTVPQFVDVQHRRLYVLSPRWDDRQGSLRVFERDGPEAGRELLDRVQTVIASSIDGMFVLRDPAGDEPPQVAADRELWFVPRQPGGARRVLDVTLRTGANGLRGDAAFSPDLRHLAIGHHPLDGTGGAIWVIDTVAGRLVEHLSGIRLEVSMLSSQIPTVLLSWRDATTLRWSRSGDDDFEWVTWSLTTREELAAERYGPIDIHHQRPPAPPPADALQVDANGIRFASASAGPPLIERPAAGWWSGASKLRLSADGRYAAWFDGAELHLVDGPGQHRRTAYRGNLEFPRWLREPD